MENVESFFQFLIDVQNRGNVSTSVAIIRCRPDCNEILVSEPVLKAIHHKLMGSSNQGNIVDMIEFLSYLWSEQPSGTPRRHSPCFDILWIWPHEVTERSFVRNFHSSIDESYLVNSLDLWGETSMDAEYLALYNSSDPKVIENFSAVLPWVCISILSDSLIIETIYCCDLASLMISSKQGDVRWVL